MALSSASFEYVRTVLRQCSGFHLDNDKSYLVETRLLPLARLYGLPSVEDLVLHLRGRRNDELLGEMVEAMLITETFFFRDGHPFEILRQVVFPEFQRLRADARSLNIWSAACSSGQEPYSVALLMRHHFPALFGWNIRLIASDLSTTMLKRARRGCYSKLEVSRGLPPELLESYFQQQEDGWQIWDDLRRTVDFRCINLSGAWPELPSLDLDLLRNVLIYFDTPTKQQILAKVRKVIRPDGYLILGGAETTHNLDDAFVPVSFGQVSLFRLRGSPLECTT